MDDVFGCRHQLGDSLSAEQHQHVCARLWLAVAATGSVALAPRHSHAALLQNLKHLQHQHARPVRWRAAQQRRCWVCMCAQNIQTHAHTCRHTQSTDSCGTHALQDKFTFISLRCNAGYRNVEFHWARCLELHQQRWLCFLARTLTLPEENYDEQIEAIPWRHQSNGDSPHGDCAEFKNTKRTM